MSSFKPIPNLSGAQHAKLEKVVEGDPGAKVVGYALDKDLRVEPIIHRSTGQGHRQRLARSGRLTRAFA